MGLTALKFVGSTQLSTGLHHYAELRSIAVHKLDALNGTLGIIINNINGNSDNGRHHNSC